MRTKKIMTARKKPSRLETNWFFRFHVEKEAESANIQPGFKVCHLFAVY